MKMWTTVEPWMGGSFWVGVLLESLEGALAVREGLLGGPAHRKTAKSFGASWCGGGSDEVVMEWVKEDR